MTESRLSRSLSLDFFSFSWWNSSYQGAFHMNFSFSRWNSGYQGAFHMNFSFSRWNSGYQGAFHTNFSFSRWNSDYQGAFHTNFSFSRWNSQNAWFGGRLFSHTHTHTHRDIYIYITKSIYIGPTSLKSLPLDLEPPLQGKEYNPSYSNATTKKKAIVFSRNHL
jgi:hypothetical protein